MFKILNKKRLQPFRFFVSGVIASVINFLVYNFFYLAFNNLVLASICGYFIGLLVSFVFAKNWVFQNNSRQKLLQSFSIFCLIYFLGGLEMSFVIVLLNQVIENYRVAWLFGAFVGSLNNYFASKYFLFRK